MKLIMGSILLSSLVAGCASYNKKDDIQVNQVRRVAIVAFDVQQPAGGSLSLTNGKLTGEIEGSMILEHSDHVNDMYNEFRKALKKNLKWQVKSTKQLQNDPAYKMAYKATMEGWQNKMPPPPKTITYGVQKIMDSDGTRLLRKAGRDELINQLGVDAIIMAKVTVRFKGTVVMGIGSRKPQATVRFQVFKRGQDEAIWRHGGLAGEISKVSVGATAFINNELLNEEGLRSAKSAFMKIGKITQ